MRKIYQYLLIIQLFYTSLSLSQYDNVSFEHISIEYNFFHYSINSILQDKEGFLWIGARTGLSLYDGKKFILFKTSESDSSISSDVIHTIFESSSGELWIGTSNGLNKYIRDKGFFKRYFSEVDGKSFIINGIIEDKKNILWVATNNGLMQYDSKSDSFICHLHNDNDNNSIYSNIIKSIAIDNYGNILLGYDSLRLDYIQLNHSSDNNTNVKMLIKHYIIGEKNRKEFIQKIFQDRKNVYWVGTLGRGVFCFEKDDLSKTQEKISNCDFVKARNLNSGQNKLSNLFVRDIIEDSYSNIWIATFGGGLNLYLRDSDKLLHFKNDQKNPESINSDFIGALYFDRSQNLWVGTYTGGLNKYSNYIEKFKLYRNQSDDPISLTNNLVTAVYKDNDGLLWVGTRQGINVINRKNKKRILIINGSEEEIAEPKNLIRSITEDNNNRIWVGTHDGVYCINRKTKKFINNFNPELQKLLKKRTIRSLFFDGNSILWVGSDFGLFEFNINDNSFKRYLNDVNDSTSISHNYVWSLHKDKYNNLWVGTKNGLNLFNEKTKKFQRFFYKTNNKVKPSDNLVISIVSDSTNTIWFGTYTSGLHKIDPQYNNSKKPDYSFSKVIHFDLLPKENASISGVMLDENQNLWVGTDEEIIMINRDRTSYRLYNLRDRISSNELNTGSYYACKDGEFLFGGNNGLVSFYPMKIKVNKNIPKIVITSFKKFNKEVYSGTVASSLKEINLTYKDNNFSFTFAALDFSDPLNNQYKYKLEGYDNDWIDAGKKNEAIYMNLPGGEYTFRVIGSNQDNIWNLEGASIQLYISPPFWETLWFKILVILFSILIIYAFFRNRIRTIERQKKMLETLVEIRTFDLKEANIKLQNEINERKKAEEEIKRTNALLSESNSTKDKLFSIIAHDLRGSIGNFMSMLRLLVAEPNLVEEKDLREILKNMEASAESTYNLLENLLSWAKSQRNAIELKPANMEISYIIDDAIALANHIAKTKNISLTSQVSSDIIAFFDKNTITTVLRNLISNALKFTKPGGKVWVDASYDDQYVIISVNDNGVGIPKQKFDSLFTISDKKTTLGTGGEKGTGLGLMLCKEFVELNNGKIWVESEEGKGTSFKFTLPR